MILWVILTVMIALTAAGLTIPLVRRYEQRPASVKTLSGTVSALFQPKLEEAEIATLLKQLQDLGVFSVNGTKVIYSLAD